ncbi:MAG: hypothetical protein WBF58_21480 [Xanthobacteraceae bacterium]
MRPEIRRIVAVEAHRRRTGSCPVRMDSLGTGETFEIKPAADGFVDLTSGLAVQVTENRITVPSLPAIVDFRLTGDIGFDGYDHSSDEPFSGRAGGGSSVTLYDRDQRDYFQYAVVAEGSRS